MRLLWLTTKDIKHPKASGREHVHHELAKRLVKNGHRVTIISTRWPGSLPEEKIEGYQILRMGSWLTIRRKVFRYYKKYLKDIYDVVIDEVHTIPFCAHRYAEKKTILFIPEIMREIWFYDFHFPFSILGYLVESWYLKRVKHKKVITTAESTKKELIRIGFKAKNIVTMREGIEHEPIKYLSENDKYKVPTMLALGAIRPYKRTDHIVKAFLMAKQFLPELRLMILGGKENNLHYTALVHDEINLSPHPSSITFIDNPTDKERKDSLQKSHVLCVTSLKEGLCRTVTEAGAQGTPAVVYNTPGLRDSIRHERTGLITRENIPKDLADNILDLFEDREKYNRMRRDAWHWGKEFTWDASYKEFIKILMNI